MAYWHISHGSWWTWQWCWDGFFSLGIHVDFRRRFTGSTLDPYGPYLDIHLGPAILSLGYWPVRSIGEVIYR